MSAAWIWTLGLGTAALGLAGALWALLWDRPRGRLRCPKCWYDLCGCEAPALCPECGRTIMTTRQMRRIRRRWRVVVPTLIVAAAAGWVAPVWATKGWTAVVPQLALDAAIGMLFEAEAEGALALMGSGPLPEGRWDRALIAWAARRSIAGAAATSEFDASVGNAMIASYHLMQDADTHERRGVPEALAQLAENWGGDMRQTALIILLAGGERSPGALAPLWRLARGVEDDLAARRTIWALMLLDPRCPPRDRGPDARTVWITRSLRAHELSSAAWRSMIDEAVDSGPRGLALVEDQIWLSLRPAADLAGAVGSIAGRRSAGEHADIACAALTRMLEHPVADVRLASAKALLYVAGPGSEAELALRRALGDSDPRVVEAAERALRWPQ